MYELMWPFLLTYGSHDMRFTGFTGFRRLTVVNETPGEWSITRMVTKILFPIIFSRTVLENGYEIVP